jgi:hypothetical protein
VPYHGHRVQKGATPHHSGKPQALEERAPRAGGNIVALDGADSGACVLEGKLTITEVGPPLVGVLALGLL